MRIPKSFYIKGKRWTVEYKWNLMDDDGDGLNVKCDGLCNPDDRVILLERSMPRGEEKWQCFLHEWVHAVLFEAHISGLDGPAGDFIEEMVCESIAQSMDGSFKIRWKRQQR